MSKTSDECPDLKQANAYVTGKKIMITVRCYGEQFVHFIVVVRQKPVSSGSFLS